MDKSDSIAWSIDYRSTTLLMHRIHHPHGTTDRVIKTRVHSWWGGKKAAKKPEAPPAKGKGAPKVSFA